MIRDRDVTLTAETPEGFLVAKVTRDGCGGRPYFSVTGDLYASRRAFDLGADIIAGGCIHDEILSHHPELAPIVRLHLADAETGEPMHAVANARYRLMGDDMGRELEAIDAKRAGDTFPPHRSYYRAPEAYDAEGYLNPDFAAYFLNMAGRVLMLDADKLAEASPAFGSDPDAFDAWAETLRADWQDAADRANAWIDGHANEVEIPAEAGDVDECELRLDGGLTVSAKLDGEGHRENVGPHYAYRVTVTDSTTEYAGTYNGSTADYQDGRINAQEAALGVLRELVMFANYDSAWQCAQELDMTDLTNDQRVEWERTHAAAVAMVDALDANADLVGG